MSKNHFGIFEKIIQGYGAFGVIYYGIWDIGYSLNKPHYRYHKLRKTFSKLYRRHYDLVSKFNTGLKSLLKQGLSEPEVYGDLVYKFRKIVGRNDYSDQLRKIIIRYRTGYSMNVMRQTACLVVDPVTVNNFAALFNCTPAGRVSDLMMATA